MADDALVSFCAVTGVNPEVAQSFLSSSNNDVELAISNYFATQEAGGSSGAAGMNEDAAAIQAAMQEDEDQTTAAATSQPAAPAGARTLGGQAAEALPAEWAQRTGSQAPAQRRTGLATLGSAGARTPAPAHNDDDDDDEDDDEDFGGPEDEPQNFFAGGERSGINVENPNKPGSNNKLVRDLLKKAAECVRCHDTHLTHVGDRSNARRLRPPLLRAQPFAAAATLSAARMSPRARFRIRLLDLLVLRRVCPARSA